MPTRDGTRSGTVEIVEVDLLGQRFTLMVAGVLCRAEVARSALAAASTNPCYDESPIGWE